jgi:excisionase family DNA binding protein
MANKDQFLTTAEFASQAGIPTSSIAKLIKDGKIKAEKKSGKWLIDPSQLNTKAVKEFNRTGKPAAKKKTAAPKEEKSAAEKPSERGEI